MAKSLMRRYFLVLTISGVGIAVTLIERNSTVFDAIEVTGSNAFAYLDRHQGREMEMASRLMG